MSSSGVRWKLHLKRLGGGKNLVYYINVNPAKAVAPEQDAPNSVSSDDKLEGEVW
jgi:hypothetical protein